MNRVKQKTLLPQAQEQKEFCTALERKAAACLRFRRTGHDDNGNERQLETILSDELRTTCYRSRLSRREAYGCEADCHEYRGAWSGAGRKAFYCDILGMTIAMDLGWIMTFASDVPTTPQPWISADSNPGQPDGTIV